MGKPNIHQHRIALLGAGGVGKSCLTVRYVQGDYCGVYDPTIEDSYAYQTTVDGVNLAVDIVDTAGADQFVHVQGPAMKTCDIFILVYDITSRKSLQHILAIHEELVRARGGALPQLVLVGNKADIEDQREVGVGHAESLARTWQCPHFLTSAKTGARVGDMFEEALRSSMRRKSAERIAHKAKGCSVM